MKLLSPKNKKLAMQILGWFGALVLLAAIVRAFRTPGASTQEKAKVLIAELKEIALKFSVFVIGCALIYFGFNVPEGWHWAVPLVTLTTGAAVVTTANTTYCPKWFMYTAATQLTGVKITVQGEGVIFDYDANGLNHSGVIRLIGQTTNSYIFTIANGFIKGKNLIWDFTNSAAQTPVIDVDSDETPPGTKEEPEMYLQAIRQAVLANSGVNFKKFAALHLPSLAATDQVNVLYTDGTQQQWTRRDLQIALGYTQNVLNTPVYTIDNFGLRVKEVNVIAAAAQTAYVQRWVPVTSGGMINQAVNQY